MCLSHLVLSPYPGSLVSLRLFSNLFPLSPWLPACFSPSLCPSLSLPSPHTIFFPSLPRPAPSPSARRLSEGADGVAGSRRRPQAGVSPDGPVGGVGVPRRHHDDQGAHLRVLLYLQEAGGLLELGGLVHVGHGHTHDRSSPHPKAFPRRALRGRVSRERGLRVLRPRPTLSGRGCGGKEGEAKYTSSRTTTCRVCFPPTQRAERVPPGCGRGGLAQAGPPGAGAQYLLPPP